MISNPNNKRRFVLARAAAAAVIALFLCGLAVAQDFRKVADGVEYAEAAKDFGGKNVNVRLLRLDLRKVRLDVHHAGASVAALGTETTSEIAKRHGGIAAVNAGFFRLDKSPYLGDPVGLFVVDGKALSEPSLNRIQLIINNRSERTEVMMGRTTMTHSLRIGTETFAIDGVNRERKENETVLYTPEFGSTTMPATAGIEFAVVGSGVGTITKDAGSSVIPRNGYVISVGGATRDAIEKALQKSDRVTLVRTWDGLPPNFARERSRLDVVAGSPLLVENGRARITWEEEKRNREFVDTRHPRTAAARLKDGKFLLITADGRTESSGGLGLEDLAAYLVELGAVEAMNLDGGGSTTMYVNGRVVNQPSDKEGERKVSDALVITPRKKR